jgi:anti-sigma B factor antagonist
VSSPTEAEITVESLPRGGSVVSVRGEVDLASADDLGRALGEGEPGCDVVVDLTECTFLDSSAIRELLAGVHDIESGGGRAAVVAQPAGVRRTLEIAGVDERLAIHPTLEAALAQA